MSRNDSRPTWTETHRHACEVREVMTWPRDKRLRYYGLVEKARGTQAATRLRDAVNAAWKARNDA